MSEDIEWNVILSEFMKSLTMLFIAITVILYAIYKIITIRMKRQLVNMKMDSAVPTPGISRSPLINKKQTIMQKDDAFSI